MTTTLLSWAAVTAACVAAVLFGQTARSAPHAHRAPRSTRIGLFLSRGGPVLALLLALAFGALTGQWLTGALAALVGVVVVAVVGLVLAPL